MSRGPRPRRESAKQAEEKIAAVYEWENCSENSEQFLKVAEHFEKEFEREGFLRMREQEGVHYDALDEESEYDEEEVEESEDYESSFVDDSEDEFADSGDDEWRPPSKRQKKEEQQEKEEDEEERKFIEDLQEATQQDEQLNASYSYDAPLDETSPAVPGYTHYMCTEVDDGDETAGEIASMLGVADPVGDYMDGTGTFLLDPTLASDSGAEGRGEEDTPS